MSFQLLCVCVCGGGEWYLSLCARLVLLFVLNVINTGTCGYGEVFVLVSDTLYK
jgi:hypothetical protein